MSEEKSFDCLGRQISTVLINAPRAVKIRRTCGYCEIKGHYTKRCPTLFEDMKKGTVKKGFAKTAEKIARGLQSPFKIKKT